MQNLFTTWDTPGIWLGCENEKIFAISQPFCSRSLLYCARAMLCTARTVLSPQDFCLTVRLSHAGIVSKRLKISSDFFTVGLPHYTRHYSTLSNSTLHMIYRTAPFSMTSTPNQDFKVTPFFDTECLRNCTRYRHSYIMEYQ